MKKSLWIVLFLALICTLALSACDDTNQPQTPNEDHVHAFSEWTIVKDATCTVKGEQERTCSCGEKETQSIDATGHTEVIDASVAATCTTDGKTEGKHCSVCNETIIAQNTIPASHTDGEWITDTDATCTVDGSKHQVCSVCTATIKTEPIAATGHTDGEWVTDNNATCTVDGSKHQVCSACNATIKTEAIAAKGHTDGEWKIDTNATCTEDGTKHQECAVCSASIKTGTIAATGHSKELDDYVAPTCQQTGLTQGSHCKICSTILEEQTEIPIINHIFDTYICTMCKAKQEPIVTFDVSQNQDFSIVLNIYYYENREDLYEIELCGPGKMKDFPFLVEYPDSPYTSILPYVRKLTIADDVTYIGDNAFYKIGNIGTLTIPDSVVGIGDFAFAHSGITSIILPASIKTLGERVFYNSRSLYNISIPDNLPGSCNDMIIQCPNLRYTKYKNGLYIGNEDNPYVMLCGTVNQIQKDFQIHSSTKIIAYEAFANYSVLESVSIPDSVTCIGDFAFSRCTSLKAISIPENTTYLGEASFYDCANLEEVSYFAKSCSYAGSPGYPLFYRCTQFTKLIIGESVQSIPENTFNICYNLVDIYNLSSLVIDLGSETHGMAGYYAFYIYSSLDEERKTILTDEEYLFAEKNSVWYLVAYLGTKTELVFPTNINGQNYCVNSNAFTYSKITKVTIVGGVDKILSYAFDTCQNLTDVFILSDLIVVDKQAFVRGNLRNLVLPNTVQNIGNSDWVSFTLYYYGTKDEWNFVENLQKNMSVYYYSENAPTDLSYQYWHFVDGVPAVW